MVCEHCDKKVDETILIEKLLCVRNAISKSGIFHVVIGEKEKVIVGR